jgi:hypothetical protein
MPGFLEPIWEMVFRIATWSALIFGTLSIGSAFVSAWVGWEITDATQKAADKTIRDSADAIKAADVRIAEATARAAEANLKAETERAERVKLELRLAPRSLDPQQFASQLSGLNGLRVDLVAYETGGTDVAALAGQIVTGLGAAGMTAYLFTPFADGTVVKGILVRCADDAPEAAKIAMSRIVMVLKSAGLDAGIWQPFPPSEPPSGAYNGPTGVTPDAKIRVLIGAKP